MKNYKHLCAILVIFLFVLQFSSYSQVIYPFTTWYKIYNGPSNLQDSAVAMAVNSAGMLFVSGISLGTGTSFDIVAVRYNPDDGNQIWEKRYVGPGDDRMTAMVCDNNAVYVTGWSIVGTQRDIITIKFNAANGDTLWVKKYNGPGGGGDYGNAIAVDAGFVYVTGRVDNSGPQKLIVLKYDIATGNQAAGFPVIYNGPLSTAADVGLSIKVAGGNIYVTGEAGFSPTPGDILTLKISPAGAVLWEKKHSGPASTSDDTPTALVVDNAGANVFVTGFSTRINDQDYITIKYSAAAGDSLAFAVYHNNVSTDIPIAMAIDGSSNIYVTGFSRSALATFEIATVKYNLNLQQQWVRRIVNTTGTDVPNGITIGTNNDLYVTGTTNVLGNADYITIRYNASTGDTIWTKKENGTANLKDYGTGVAVLDSSKVFVTGSAIFTPATTASFYTLRYSNLILGIRPISTEIPVTYKVHQNYPNPFNPVTSIRFDIPKKSIVEVIVYDVMGRVVELLGKENLDAGKYEVKWDAAKYSSGLYFYKVQAGEFSQVKKMILAK